MSFDVGGRVGLGEPEALRLGERRLEAFAGRRHGVEDEVGRSVDDAEHALDRVAGKRLAQRPDDRDRSGHSRLEREVTVGFGRSVVDGLRVLGEQCLVGGYDGRAVLERGQDQLPGRLDAADQLDHDVQVAAGDEATRVSGEQLVGQSAAVVSIEVTHGDADELQRHADPVRQFARILRQDARDLGTDDATAKQRDLEGAHRTRVSAWTARYPCSMRRIVRTVAAGIVVILGLALVAAAALGANSASPLGRPSVPERREGPSHSAVQPRSGQGRRDPQDPAAQLLRQRVRKARQAQGRGERSRRSGLCASRGVTSPNPSGVWATCRRSRTVNSGFPVVQVAMQRHPRNPLDLRHHHRRRREGHAVDDQRDAGPVLRGLRSSPRPGRAGRPRFRDAG